MSQPKPIGVKVKSFNLIYGLPGSSPLHNFESLIFQFYFDLKKKNKTIIATLYFEFFQPKILDLMISQVVDLPLEPVFYEQEDFLKQMADHTYSDAIKIFNAAYSQLNEDEIEIVKDPKTINDMVDLMRIESPKYFKAFHDMKLFLSGNVFEVQYVDGVNMLLQFTMHILDEIFLECPSCDRLRNREKFVELSGMGFVEYLGLREKCNNVTKKVLGFNAMEAMRILQLIDCAAQVLISPVFEKLSEKFTEMQVTKENLKTYLNEAERFNKQVLSTIKPYMRFTPKTTVPIIDWGSVFK